MPANPVSDAPADRFHWRPGARLFDAAGRPFGRGAIDQMAAGPPPAGHIAPWPPAPALIAALALAERGRAFRIGGAGAPVGNDAPRPMFETLTSGSSGAPRRISRAQASWIESFAVNAGLFGIRPGVAVAVLGRLEHSLALYGALEALHLGADLHLLAGLRADRQAMALAAREIAVLYATPAQIRLLTDGRPVPAPGLRHVLVGGAKLDPATRAACAAAFPGARIREFYGAAETSFITLADDATPPGAVGRPYPGVEIAIRDDQELPAPEGAVGRIWVSSPYLFAGYASGEVAQTRWRDGWLTIGEHGRMRQGRLYLAGRESRMVTIADQNVFPEEVEAFLLSLPGVARAAVLARADRRRGHVLEAVIMGEADGEAVLAACRAGLGPLKAPRRVAVRGDWPMLPSGKTDLAALQEAGG